MTASEAGSCSHPDTLATAVQAYREHTRNEWVRQVADDSPGQVFETLRASVAINMTTVRTLSKAGATRTCAAIMNIRPTAGGIEKLKAERGTAQELAQRGISMDSTGKHYAVHVEFKAQVTDDKRQVVVYLDDNANTAAAVYALGLVASNELSLTHPDWK